MPAFGVKLIRSLKAPVSANVGGRSVGSSKLSGRRNVVFGSRCNAMGDWAHKGRFVTTQTAMLRTHFDIVPRAPPSQPPRGGIFIERNPVHPPEPRRGGMKRPIQLFHAAPTGLGDFTVVWFSIKMSLLWSCV